MSAGAGAGAGSTMGSSVFLQTMTLPDVGVVEALHTRGVITSTTPGLVLSPILEGEAEKVLKEMHAVAEHPLGAQLISMLQQGASEGTLTKKSKNDIALRVRFLLYIYFCTAKYVEANVVVNLLEMNGIAKEVLTEICENNFTRVDVTKIVAAMGGIQSMPLVVIFKTNQEGSILPLSQMLFRTTSYDLGRKADAETPRALNSLRLKFIHALGVTHYYRFGWDNPCKTGKKKTILRSIVENKCVTVFMSLLTSVELKCNLDFTIGGEMLAVLLCRYWWDDKCIIALLEKYPRQGYLVTSPTEGVDVNLFTAAIEYGRGTLILAMIEFYIGSGW